MVNKGYSYKEISQILDVSVGTISNVVNSKGVVEERESKQEKRLPKNRGRPNRPKKIDPIRDMPKDEPFENIEVEVGVLGDLLTSSEHGQIAESGQLDRPTPSDDITAINIPSKKKRDEKETIKELEKLEEVDFDNLPEDFGEDLVKKVAMRAMLQAERALVNFADNPAVLGHVSNVITKCRNIVAPPKEDDSFNLEKVKELWNAA